MLILTRRISEKIIIDIGGELIEVVPLDVNGSQVKIGVQAPRHIDVHREEIFNKIQQEKSNDNQS
jgi:carbon storage regulator